MSWRTSNKQRLEETYILYKLCLKSSHIKYCILKKYIKKRLEKMVLKKKNSMKLDFFLIKKTLTKLWRHGRICLRAK